MESQAEFCLYLLTIAPPPGIRICVHGTRQAIEAFGGMRDDKGWVLTMRPLRGKLLVQRIQEITS